MAPRASVFFQYQILLFRLVSLELLCKPHRTLLGPALPRILFAREEVPTCQGGLFPELNEQICGAMRKTFFFFDKVVIPIKFIKHSILLCIYFFPRAWWWKKPFCRLVPNWIVSSTMTKTAVQHAPASGLRHERYYYCYSITCYLWAFPQVDLTLWRQPYDIPKWRDAFLLTH